MNESTWVHHACRRTNSHQIGSRPPRRSLLRTLLPRASCNQLDTRGVSPTISAEVYVRQGTPWSPERGIGPGRDSPALANRGCGKSRIGAPSCRCYSEGRYGLPSHTGNVDQGVSRNLRGLFSNAHGNKAKAANLMIIERSSADHTALQLPRHPHYFAPPSPS